MSVKTSNKYSDLKIAWFPEKLNSLKDNYVTAPIHVMINPTNRCNHNCFFCVYNYDYSLMHDTMNIKDELSTAKILETLHSFKKIGVKSITYSGGGEPLIHPGIEEVLQLNKDLGIDIAMITNAQLLYGNKANLLKDSKWIRVSVDYSNYEEFKKSGRGSLDKYNQILENISNFSKMKTPECDLTVNYIITKENYKNLFNGALLLKSLNVDNIRFSPVYTKDFLDYHSSIKAEVLQTLNDIKKYLETDTFKIYHSYYLNENFTKRNYNKCYFQQIVPVIGGDYNVYNCHNKAYTPEGMIGSIKNQTFEEFWFSEDTKKHFERFNAKKECVCQCAADNKNLFIHELINFHGDSYV